MHTSPWATYRNRDEMLDEIWPDVGKVWAVDLEVFSAGDHYFVRYRHNLEGSEPMAERIWFDGSVISRIEVYPFAG